MALWQAEQERQKLANGPDADGFTTVVRKKRTGGQEGDGLGPNRKRKKKNNPSLQNFYRFQMRESKRERE